jgi:hypothetical protein
MKRIWFLLIFLTFSGALFAVDLQDRHIYMDGHAEKWEHLSFFMYNFMMEAANLGYTFADTKAEAAFSFQFEVVPNVILYDDGTEEPAPPDEKQFILLVGIINNLDDTQLVTFGFPFTEVDEMYAYTQILFLRAILSIPSDAGIITLQNSAIPQEESPLGQENQLTTEEVTLIAQEPLAITQETPELTEETPTITQENPFITQESPVMATENEDWKNKRLYAWAFVGGQMLLQDEIEVLPGLTVGAEYLILDWMSIGANFKLNVGIADFSMYMAAGLQLMFPIKSIRNLMLEPYAAFSYPVYPVQKFDQFPPLAVGGGIQVGIKGGNNGSIFADLNVMYKLADPPELHYQHLVIGLRIGYKYGFF